MRFIDIIKDSDAQVNQVRQLVETGYKLQLTAMNGKWSFYGGMSSDLFMAKIREILGGKEELRGVTR